MDEEKIFDFGAFWCELVDRLLLAKARSTCITRNRFFWLSSRHFFRLPAYTERVGYRFSNHTASNGIHSPATEILIKVESRV